ncbi:tetratricopeptide repeat protein 17-like [Asterias rubens]|uniref:tetratricopeptide repeat protein 17-like n=1 Tax=Asterias rubens TaxID=7604 RepID=UPI00145599A7|nr:tetratricopeptide repeat protein 17-like [Asterias rubens]
MVAHTVRKMIVKETKTRTFALLIVMLLLCFTCSEATTHWLVTEQGMITQQLNSDFNMREPYNLIAFLKQGRRSNHIRELEVELEHQKREIEANEDKDLDLEQRFLSTDADCISAQEPLAQHNLYPTMTIPFSLKNIKVSDYVDLSATSESKKTIEPNCTKVLPLPFSMHAYDHLQGIQGKNNLTDFAESIIGEEVKGTCVFEGSGPGIYNALEENKTSWQLYTIATFYWRSVGNSEQVIECGRRALHFAPRKDKNIVLVNMASVLHRSHYSTSAAILAEAALESGEELAKLHLLLGSIYATIGEYDRSVSHFEQSINLGITDSCWAQRRIHAVRCHQKLEQALEAQHLSLKRTLSELQDFKIKQDEFEKVQKKMKVAQCRVEDQFESNLSYHRHRLNRGLADNPHCQMKDMGDGSQSVVCTRGTQPDLSIFGIPLQDDQDVEMVDTASIRNNCLQLPNGEESCFNLSAGLRRSYTAYFNPGNIPPPPWNRIDWPSENDCRNVPHELPEWSKYAPTYLPPESKGLRVKHLVNENLNLFENDVHPLPWFPPVCVTVETLTDGNTAMDFVESITQRASLPLTDTIKSLSPQLLALVNSNQASEEELSQRILTAFEEPKNADEKWLLYNLGGFYWLMIGNNFHGVECLRRALVHAPVEYADVPLVNAASVLLHAGKAEDAVQLLRMALVVNKTEPITHFVLANAMAASGNLDSAANEFIVALNSDPKDQYLNSLKQLKCFLKWEDFTRHQNEDEVKGQRLHQRESRTVCSHNSNGEERCQTETRTREFVPRDTETCSKDDPSCNERGETDCWTSNGEAGRNHEAPSSVDHLPKVDKSHVVNIRRPAQNGEPVRVSLNRESETVPPPASGPNIPAIKPSPNVDSSDFDNLTRLPWPTLDDCKQYKKVNLKMLYTTWVSVTAKSIRIEDHIDLQSPLLTSHLEPVCNAEVGTSMHTLDHLQGMAHRANMEYMAELGLDEALESLQWNESSMTVESAGTRIALALQKNTTSWVLTNMAAVYWRRSGNAVNALNCLRVALHYSDHMVKDLALISIANIFHRTGFIDDGIVVAQMAWEISSELVLCQFTLANLYAAKGQFDKAIQLYETMVIAHTSFSPAIERLKTIKCAVLQKTNGNPASMFGKLT